MNPNRVRVILVRPRNPLNIGACARALANFGFEDLFVVDPYGPVWREARSAVGAEDVLRRARAGTMDEALEGCDLVIGTSALKNRVARREVVDLPEADAWISARLPARGKLAVLFGPEKTGLGNAELARCAAVIRIPTSLLAPSMNLGQAVAVVAYALTSAGAVKRGVKTLRALSPSAAQKAAFVRGGLEAFARLKFMDGVSEEAKSERLRLLLVRGRLTRTDAALLQGLFRRAR